MSNETKHTAVEWLYNELLNSEPNILEWNKLLEQAKEINKKQMIDFALECQEMFKHQIEEKYNQTYGGNK